MAHLCVFCWFHCDAQGDAWPVLPVGRWCDFCSPLSATFSLSLSLSLFLFLFFCAMELPPNHPTGSLPDGASTCNNLYANCHITRSVTKFGQHIIPIALQAQLQKHASPPRKLIRTSHHRSTRFQSGLKLSSRERFTGTMERSKKKNANSIKFFFGKLTLKTLSTVASKVSRRSLIFLSFFSNILPLPWDIIAGMPFRTLSLVEGQVSQRSQNQVGGEGWREFWS